MKRLLCCLLLIGGACKPRPVWIIDDRQCFKELWVAGLKGDAPGYARENAEYAARYLCAGHLEAR